MSLSLPGPCNIFSQLPAGLTASPVHCIILAKGVHDALDDFWWLAKELTARQTCIAELVPLAPIAEGHHDASGSGCGGIWFPAPTASMRKGFTQHPILWCLCWPQHISDALVSDKTLTAPSQIWTLNLPAACSTWTVQHSVWMFMSVPS